MDDESCNNGAAAFVEVEEFDDKEAGASGGARGGPKSSLGKPVG